MRINLLYTVFLACFSVWHPFHVSVTDIVHNKEAQSIQVSQRIFIDDLEQGLKKFHGLGYVDTYQPKDLKRLDSLIAGYLAEKVFFRINGKEYPFKYLGSEVESDARWCYYEIEGIAAVSEAEITNALLMEIFDDQQNIVHFKANETLKSYKLDKEDTYTTFNF